KSVCKLRHLIAFPSERYEMELERCDRFWPYQPLLVRQRLDDNAHKPRRSDAIGAHDNVLFRAALIGVGQAERFRETRSQIEDVPRLDSFLFDKLTFLE